MAIQADWTRPTGRGGRRTDRRRRVRRASDKHGGAVGEWMIQQRRQPVFVIDAHLKVLCSNRAAREALEQIDWMCTSWDQLEIKDPALVRKLRRALAEWPEARSGSIWLASGTRKLDLSVLEPSHPLRRVYVLEIVQPLDMTVGHEQLVRSFRLSNVQAKVALVIYECGSQKVAVDRLGKSINTVKTHVRSIFEKVGVNSQHGLVRKMAELAARGYLR